MCFIMHLTDAQPTGFVHMKYKRFFRVKEMMPELVVPDRSVNSSNEFFFVSM